MDIIIYWVGGFAFFAFLTNLIREIIKDIEDFEGDIAYGRNTVPVVIGVLSCKNSIDMSYTDYNYFALPYMALFYK